MPTDHVRWWTTEETFSFQFDSLFVNLPFNFCLLLWEDDSDTLGPNFFFRWRENSHELPPYHGGGPPKSVGAPHCWLQFAPVESTSVRWSLVKVQPIAVQGKDQGRYQAKKKAGLVAKCGLLHLHWWMSTWQKDIWQYVAVIPVGSASSGGHLRRWLIIDLWDLLSFGSRNWSACLQ